MHLRDVWFICNSDKGVKQTYDGRGGDHLGIDEVSQKANLRNGGRDIIMMELRMWGSCMKN